MVVINQKLKSGRRYNFPKITKKTKKIFVYYIVFNTFVS